MTGFLFHVPLNIWCIFTEKELLINAFSNCTWKKGLLETDRFVQYHYLNQEVDIKCRFETNLSDKVTTWWLLFFHSLMRSNIQPHYFMENIYLSWHNYPWLVLLIKTDWLLHIENLTSQGFLMELFKKYLPLDV